MNLEKAPLQADWPAKTSNTILIVFIALILPVIRIGSGSHHWASLYALDGYMVLVLTTLLLNKKISLKALGVSGQNLKQNLVTGVCAGGAIILCLPILDLLIDATGLSKTELFSHPISDQYQAPSLLRISVALGHGILDQLFFLGLIAQVWLKKYNPFLVIYFVGVVFAIAHAQLTLGIFAIGLIDCLLFYLTGTLIAPAIFQMACLASGFLLETTYPRLVTLLGFLF